MSEQYPWAVNDIKLQRAIAAAKNRENEQEIKELYVSWGGKIANGFETSEEPVVEEAPVEETPVETPAEEVAGEPAEEVKVEDDGN